MWPTDTSSIGWKKARKFKLTYTMSVGEKYISNGNLKDYVAYCSATLPHLILAYYVDYFAGIRVVYVLRFVYQHISTLHSAFYSVKSDTQIRSQSQSGAFALTPYVFRSSNTLKTSRVFFRLLIVYAFCLALFNICVSVYCMVCVTSHRLWCQNRSFFWVVARQFDTLHFLWWTNKYFLIYCFCGVSDYQLKFIDLFFSRFFIFE